MYHRRVYAIRGSGTMGERRKLACALEGKGYRFPTRKALKTRLAGAVDKMLRDLDAGLLALHARFPMMEFPQHHMNAPELREAFDAVAKDLFRNETDIDLPPGDEAF